MNAPPAIQNQQAKWMEIILIWLGILIPIQLGPVIYQYLRWSQSTPELLSNGLGAFLFLFISLGLLLRYRTLSCWILNTSSPSPETPTQHSELSGWLTIGIFTFGILALVHTIPTILFSLGDRLSPWLAPNQETLVMTGDKMWFYFAIFCLNSLPQLIMALFLTLFPQPLGKWTISLQERWGSLKTETPVS